MKTDIELLTLAAKAVGIVGEAWDYTLPGESEESYFALRLENGDVWSPLHDDGDAFRLAVKLNIDLMHATGSEGDNGGQSVTFPVDGDYDGLTELHDTPDGKLAATRRAIVRAAAQIGEAMP